MTNIFLSLNRLERAVLGGALFVLLMTVITSTGILPRRSFASMTFGFLMLSAIAIEPVLLLCFIARTMTRKSERGQYWRTILLIGVMGSVPAMVFGIRLIH